MLLGKTSYKTLRYFLLMFWHLTCSSLKIILGKPQCNLYFPSHLFSKCLKSAYSVYCITHSFSLFFTLPLYGHWTLLTLKVGRTFIIERGLCVCYPYIFRNWKRFIYLDLDYHFPPGLMTYIIFTRLYCELSLCSPVSRSKHLLYLTAPRILVGT